VKTFVPREEEIQRDWYVVDAEGQTLGRLAVQIANVLRGKNKPIFTPHMDCGDFVIVLNAEKVMLTGNKEDQKLYRRHSGYPHGFREETARSLRARLPEAIVERAVKGMLPHTRLGARQFTKLKVYTGGTHPHAAQNPKKLDV
jgi:large subunit ribosomal protein L13